MRLRLLIGWLAALAGGPLAAEEARPHVLWLSWEDCSPRLGCYGDPLARTPALDALAAGGQRYVNAFATFPVCAPTRASIITGMHPTTVGTHQMRCQTRLPQEVRMFPAWLRQAGYYTTNNAKEDYQHPGPTPPEVWDESSPRAHWKNRPRPEQPFFAVFNFTRTHESQSHRLDADPPPAGSEGWVDPASVELPPYYPDTPKVRQALAQHYRRIAELDRWVARHLADLKAAGLADDTIVICWSDHGDGRPRAKRWIRASGLRVPLIVHIPEKWRGRLPAGQFSPGRTEERLVALMDLAPTTLALCGLEAPAHMQARAFLGPDRPPAPAFLVCGRNRMDERYDFVRGVTDGRFLYVRNFEPWRRAMPQQDYGEKHVIMQEIRRLEASGGLPPITLRWLQPGRPAEELFDLQTDPHEVSSLAEDPAHAERLSSMRAALESWQKETRDLGLLPEPLVRHLEMEHGTQAAILEDAADPAAEARRLIAAAEAEPGSFSARLRELHDALAAGRTGPDTQALALSLLENPHPYVPLSACDIIDHHNFHAPAVIQRLKELSALPQADEYLARIGPAIVRAAEAARAR